MGTRTFVNERVSFSPTKAASRGVDMPLVLIVVALVVFGLIMLYSASYDFSFNEYGSATYMFGRQLRWLGLGAVMAFVLSLFDYHNWRRIVVVAMLGTIGLLVAVAIINEPRLGAVRTLYKGSYQPSEIAKLVSVIYLSVWLYSKRQFLHDIGVGLIPLGVILGIIGGLIYKQPDLSAAGTVIILGGLLFFLAGADIKQIIFILILAVGIGFLITQFSTTGQARVAEYLAGWQDPNQCLLPCAALL